MASKRKPKIGRPSLGRNARVVPVMVKATARERKEWERRAKAEGMSLGAWVAEPRRKEAREGR